MPQGVVEEVIPRFDTVRGYNLHRVKFEGQPPMMEKADFPDTPTKFKVGELAQYEITHPGFNGKPHWIRFVAAGLGDPPEKDYDGSTYQPIYEREYRIVYQVALTAAVAHCGLGSSPKTVLDVTDKFADAIIEGSKRLAKKDRKAEEQPSNSQQKEDLPF